MWKLEKSSRNESERGKEEERAKLTLAAHMYVLELHPTGLFCKIFPASLLAYNFSAYWKLYVSGGNTVAGDSNLQNGHLGVEGRRQVNRQQPSPGYGAWAEGGEGEG